MSDSPIYDGARETPIFNRAKYGAPVGEAEELSPAFEQGYRRGWDNGVKAYERLEPLEPIDLTPNNVIKNPNVRITIATILYLVSMGAGLAALLFGIFPELSYGTDIPSRVIMFINGSVSIISGGFGIVVSNPNVPLKRGK